MKFTRKDKSYFIFFNGKYYFGLEKEDIENGLDDYFWVNHVLDLDHDPELIKKYPKKEISKKEINQQIEIIRNKYPELML